MTGAAAGPGSCRRGIVARVSSGDEFMIGGYPLSGIVRRARRKADLSQRELAKHAKVSASLIGQIETGTALPSLPTLQRILNTANYLLLVADVDGRLVAPLEVWQDVADGAGRRYPAPLDTILDPEFGEWWADVYGQWEVRVAQYRDRPRPRLPPGWKPGDEWLDDAR